MRGIDTRVALWGTPADTWGQVQVIDTESRTLCEEEAVNRVCSSAVAGVEVFKKIDSTMRGNVQAELLALRKIIKPDLILVAPALPAQRRTVVGGKLTSNGLAMADLLNAFPCFRTGHLGLDDIASSKIAQKALLDMTCRGIELVVADARDEQHLVAVAAAVRALGKRVVLVGSSGLAQALAEAIAPQALPNSRVPRRLDCPCLIGIGSDHPVTIEQTDYLRSRTGIQFVSLDDCRTADGTILLDLKRETTERQVADFVGHHPLSNFAGLILSGGDTAAMFLHMLHAIAIDLAGEILPGVPWGQVVGGLANGLPVITKSGGFGPPETLLHCIESLQLPTKLLIEEPSA